jgi:CheY-like chemotaxis protein
LLSDGKSSATEGFVSGRGDLWLTKSVSSGLRDFVGMWDVKLILLLDDEPIVMKLLRSILSRYGLLEATRGDEALLLFIDHDHQVDLLIADVTIPKRSGVQVALLLRSKLPGLPVILTCGYPVGAWSDRDSADLKRLGSHLVTILEKPFRAQALLKAVSELVGAPPTERVRTA